ncbi:hypothetical protein [Kineococcus sp. SYSU DK004]|uniref:hypothetical protein n=1 Tax=Kineococcus sp. SYSU DK004 TaxID=3383125 RepID=UPI003D7DC0ED
MLVVLGTVAAAVVVGIVVVAWRTSPRHRVDAALAHPRPAHREWARREEQLRRRRP